MYNFAFPNYFEGRKSSYLVPLPQEQGRQVWRDELRTPRLELPELASEQGLYQAANGGHGRAERSTSQVCLKANSKMVLESVTRRSA